MTDAPSTAAARRPRQRRAAAGGHGAQSPCRSSRGASSTTRSRRCQSSITADTGWSSVAVTGAFSLAQFVSGGVGIWVGRHIDEVGPRKVMTAGSRWSPSPASRPSRRAPNLALFYLGWVLVGVAMAGTLYPPAFAALTRWGGYRRVRALTTLTLVAGLASTVFAPLASVLDDWLGWRDAYLVLLAGLVARHGPAALVGPEPPMATASPPTPRSRTDATRSGYGPLPSSAPFLLLAVANGVTALAVVRGADQPGPDARRAGHEPEPGRGSARARRCGPGLSAGSGTPGSRRAHR